VTVEQSGGALPSDAGGRAIVAEEVAPRGVVRSPFVLLGDADAEACGPDGCALPD
jgi:hypothetical protein